MTTPPKQRKPDWIKIRPPAGESYLKIKDMLAGKEM